MTNQCAVGDSGDELLMEQETYPYVGVTSLNCDGTEMSPLDVRGSRARSLTNESKDDFEWKTTLLEQDGSKEVTNFRDGLNHQIETT